LTIMTAIERTLDPVAHTRRRLVGDFEPQMQPVSTDRAVGGGQQKDRLKPFVQWNVAALEQRPDRRAKLFAAAAAELQADAGSFTADRAYPIGRATVRTDRAARPRDFLELGMRRLFVPKTGL
jgi:hypothetical protein